MWYLRDEVYEIEAIEPSEDVKTNESVSFTEVWYLFPFQFLQNREPEINVIKQIINNL